MKKLKISIFLFLICSSLYSQENKTSKIIVFRNDNYYAKGINITVNLNNKLFEKVQNASYKELIVPADATYVINLTNNKRQSHTFIAKADSVYAFEVSIVKNILSYYPILSPRDLYFTEQSIANYKLFNLDQPIPSTFHKHRVSFVVSSGIGFSNVNLFVATNGEVSSISSGGGVGMKISAAKEIEKWFEVGGDIGFQISSLSPVLRDAKADFSRKFISFYPSLVKSFGRFNTTKLRLGVGPSYYFDNKMVIDLSKVSSGRKATWEYDNSLGVQSFFMIDFLSRKNFSVNMGLNYYSVKYKFNSTSGSYYPIDTRLINSDGSGLDFIFGVSYLF